MQMGQSLFWPEITESINKVMYKLAQLGPYYYISRYSFDGFPQRKDTWLTWMQIT